MGEIAIKNTLNMLLRRTHKDKDENNELDFDKCDFRNVCRYFSTFYNEICPHIINEEEKKKIQETVVGINSINLLDKKLQRIVNGRLELKHIFDRNIIANKNEELKTPNFYAENLISFIDISNNLFHSCIDRKKEIKKTISENEESKEIRKVDDLASGLAVTKHTLIAILVKEFYKNKEIRKDGVNIGLGIDTKSNDEKKIKTAFVADISKIGQLSFHMPDFYVHSLREHGLEDYCYEIASKEDNSDTDIYNRDLILKNNKKAIDNSKHQKAVINSSKESLVKNLNDCYFGPER